MGIYLAYSFTTSHGTETFIAILLISCSSPLPVTDVNMSLTESNGVLGSSFVPKAVVDILRKRVEALQSARDRAEAAENAEWEKRTGLEKQLHAVNMQAYTNQPARHRSERKTRYVGTNTESGANVQPPRNSVTPEETAGNDLDVLLVTEIRDVGASTALTTIFEEQQQIPLMPKEKAENDQTALLRVEHETPNVKADIDPSASVHQRITHAPKDPHDSSDTMNPVRQGMPPTSLNTYVPYLREFLEPENTQSELQDTINNLQKENLGFIQQLKDMNTTRPRVAFGIDDMDERDDDHRFRFKFHLLVMAVIMFPCTILIISLGALGLGTMLLSFPLERCQQQSSSWRSAHADATPLPWQEDLREYVKMSMTVASNLRTELWMRRGTTIPGSTQIEPYLQKSYREADNMGEKLYNFTSLWNNYHKSSALRNENAIETLSMRTTAGPKSMRALVCSLVDVESRKLENIKANALDLSLSVMLTRQHQQNASEQGNEVWHEVMNSHPEDGKILKVTKGAIALTGISYCKTTFYEAADEGSLELMRSFQNTLHTRANLGKNLWIDIHCFIEDILWLHSYYAGVRHAYKCDQDGLDKDNGLNKEAVLLGQGISQNPIVAVECLDRYAIRSTGATRSQWGNIVS